MDKYHAFDFFFFNIVIHNTLFIYGRMAGYEIRDPKRVLGFYRLVGSHIVLI